MDVVYMDSYGREIGILPWVEGDFTIGKSNTFSLKVPKDLGIEQDYRLAIDGEEYGGVIDDVNVDTSADYLTVSGRTWHGLLEKRIIRPDDGEDYYIVSGDLNTVLAGLVTRLDLDDCIVASESPSGVSVSNYQFERYVDAYTGIRAMLTSANCKLQISYDPSLCRAVLSAVERGSYIDDGVDGDRIDFKIGRNRPVNHLIGLGKGDLSDRAVVDVYADANGNVSEIQTLFGSQLKEETYEASNSEADKLKEDTFKKLQDMQKDLSTCQMKDVEGDNYDIDDIVGGIYSDQNISVTTFIAQKIASIKGKVITVQTNTENEVV